MDHKWGGLQKVSFFLLLLAVILLGAFVLGFDPVVTSVGDIDGDGMNDTLTNTGLVSRRMNITGNMVALNTPELWANEDFNDDGDKGDSILHYYNTSTGNLTNTQLNIGHSDLSISGSIIALAIKENGFEGINEDINDDGDTADAILHYYDISTGTLTNTEINNGLGSVIIWDNIIALTTIESDIGEDLNDDGDTDDALLRYYNISSGTLTNTNISLGGTTGGGVDLSSNNIIIFQTPEGNISFYDLSTEQQTITTIPFPGKMRVTGDLIAFWPSEGVLKYYNTSDGATIDTTIPIGLADVAFSEDFITIRTPSGVSKTLQYYDRNTGVLTDVDAPIGWGGLSVSDNHVAITSYEAAWSADEDLNNDGDKNDLVFQYLSLSKYAPPYRPLITLGNLSTFTNFTEVDISRIKNLTLVGNLTQDNVTLENVTFSKIEFTELVNLSNGSDINLNDFVNISHNLIEIDSQSLPQLNKRATLSFYNLTYNDPQLLRNGELCPQQICQKINYSEGTLVFSVTQFSAYSARENTDPTPQSPNPGGGGGGGGGGGPAGPTPAVPTPGISSTPAPEPAESPSEATETSTPSPVPESTGTTGTTATSEGNLLTGAATAETDTSSSSFITGAVTGVRNLTGKPATKAVGAILVVVIVTLLVHTIYKKRMKKRGN